MILLRQVLFSIGLIFFLSTGIALSFASGEGWAATSIQDIVQPHTQIAAMDQVKAITKNIEGTVQEAIDHMTGDPKTQAAGEGKNLDPKTQKMIDRSIENPNYQPGGKTKQMENQTRQATEDIKAEVREAFKD